MLHQYRRICKSLDCWELFKKVQINLSENFENTLLNKEEEKVYKRSIKKTKVR